MNLQEIILPAALFFSTYILEDPTAYWGIVLVQEGQVGQTAAWFSVSLGIFTGDLLLYLAGRYGTGVRWIDLQTAKIFHKAANNLWFRKINDALAANSAYMIVLARFMPGFRLPVYFLSGRNRISLIQFTLLTLVMAFGWVGLIFSGFHFSFHYLAAITGFPPLVLYILLFLLFIVSLRLLALLREPWQAKVLLYKLGSLLKWEFWPAPVFYFPLAFYIIWLMLKERIFITSLAAANPCFRFGGLSFDSKSEMLELFAGQEKYLARTLYRGNGSDLEKMKLVFPLIAKPDKGHRGEDVKVVHDRDGLLRYAASVRRPFILQEYADYPFELGVFWLKKPWEKEGQIWSVTRKILPEVAGDGKSSLQDLILSDGRARLIAETYFSARRDDLETVPRAGERVRLVTTGNHCKGAIFEDGAGDISGKTAEKIREICESVPGFYFGRFDIKFRNRKSFSNGNGFKILEVNGAEAEATHIYDSRNSLMSAYSVLFEQWSVLFKITRYNLAAGIRPVPAVRGLVQYARFFLFKL